MKRININTQQTHFIGCWNLENSKLCNEITNFFENNKNLQRPGVSGAGKNLKIKKTTDIPVNPQDLKNPEFELSNSTDPGLFKNDFEKNLYKKIHDLRKYFTSISKDENYELSLKNLAESKNTVFDFFDNVMVNVNDVKIKSNRLSILKKVLDTLKVYADFSKIQK
mgnify:CR=1 FL=1